MASGFTNSAIEFRINEIRGSLIRAANLMKQQNLGKKVTWGRLEDLAKGYIKNTHSGNFLRQALFSETEKLSESIRILSGMVEESDFKKIMVELIRGELKFDKAGAEKLYLHLRKSMEV